MSTKPNSKTKFMVATAFIALLIGIFFGLKFYRLYFSPNVYGQQKYLYIKTGDQFEDLMANIKAQNVLKDEATFAKAATKMHLAALKLKPGKYRLKTGMNNRALINMLKAGNQEPVKLKFHNIRKKESFAAYLGKELETDSATFSKYLDSATLIEKFGFNPDNFYTMFIPNTYEFYWSVTPEAFLERMNKEYLKFWTPARLQKAKTLALTPQEVTVLASIVDAEALYDSEMPTIAGLYLNRLEKGILLQADPTVIFANNDFTVKRVTGLLLRKDSKYNTYRYAGLPPGPIGMPSINAIDAVLNREKNDFIYMCAKEDFSGYHNFAVTSAQHEVNAKKYRQALDNRNIYR